MSNGGEARLIWTSRPGDVYTVWSCHDIESGAWVEEGTVLSQGGTTSWMRELPLGCRCFYRVEMR